MRVLVWISEGSWPGCVDAARRVVGDDDEVTLVHVAALDVEEMAGGAHGGLLGRHPPHPPGPALREASLAEAQALLAAAQQRLGRPARLLAMRGRVEREVLSASGAADLLVLARGGQAGHGPRSLGPRARFVVDHATCALLLVPDESPLPSER